TAPVGAAYEYNIDGGAYQSSVTFAGLAPGTHTLTARLAASTTCVSAATAGITVNAQPLTPTATISYSASSFCPSGTVSVTQSGQTGGTYSGTPGLVIDPSTGTIDLVNSTAGLHTITYSFTNGPCSNTATATITIYSKMTFTVSAANVVCKGTSTGTVTVTVTSGGSGHYNFKLISGATVLTGSPSSGINSYQFTGVAKGVYSIIVEDINTSCTTVCP
ncbi:hypothetical protein C3K47_19360, partial [Solitalea longa]